MAEATAVVVNCLICDGVVTTGHFHAAVWCHPELFFCRRHRAQSPTTRRPANEQATNPETR